MALLSLTARAAQLTMNREGIRQLAAEELGLKTSPYRFAATEGEYLASGFLSFEDKNRVILRQIGTDDRVIPRNQIDAHKISKRSLMPEGLINGYTDQQVADLFAYLMSLK